MPPPDFYRQSRALERRFRQTWNTKGSRRARYAQNVDSYGNEKVLLVQDARSLVVDLTVDTKDHGMEIIDIRRPQFSIFGGLQCIIRISLSDGENNMRFIDFRRANCFLLGVLSI